MKIITWNVNGIRAVHKKGFCGLTNQWKPDILCVQETKAHPDQIEPDLLCADGMKSYWSAAARKGYSGVATFTREEPKSVSYGIGIPEFDSEGRFVVTDHGEFELYNVYFPNGGSGLERHNFKQKFLKDFLAYLKARIDSGHEVILVGDYNVAHKEVDVYNPEKLSSQSGFLPEERRWFDDFLNAGFVDIYRQKYPNEKDKYTWWDMRTFGRVNNRGWRIDYICSTKKTADRVKNIEIWDHVEGSDHCPVMVEI
jgi:exodeoxyribonuclease-3